jgi:hypothetical protein
LRCRPQDAWALPARPSAMTGRHVGTDLRSGPTP